MKKINFTLFNYVLWGVALFLFSGASIHSQEIKLNAADDAVVFSENPDETAVFFHNSNIVANKTDDDNEIYSFIKFDVGAFANRTIKSARFSTRGSAKEDTEAVIRLRRAGTSFSRDTTSWNNKPGLGQELATKIYSASSARREYDPVQNRLVDYINEELAKGSAEIAFAIQYKEGDQNAVSWIGGKGDGAWGPELIIEFDQGMTYLPVEDAVAFKEDPDRTGADFHASNILVTRIDENTEAVAFVKFELKGYAYKLVSAAEFSTRGTAKADKSQIVQLRKAGQGFGRDTTGWNNMPGMSGKLATREYIPSSARTAYNEIDSRLVDYINEVLATGQEVIAFGLQYDEGDLDAGNWIGGRDDGLWGPILEVTPDQENYSAFAIDDAVVFSDKPEETANEFHGSNIIVYETDDGRAVSFIKFDVSAFSGRQVSEVKFSTRSSMASGQTMTVRLTNAGDGFSRDTTSWNNKPNHSGKLATAIYDDNSGRKVFAPEGDALVNYVNGKLMGGAEVISFGLEYDAGDGSGLNWIGGKGDGAWGPMLEMKMDYSYGSYASGDAVIFEHEPDNTASSFHATNLLVRKTDDENIVSFVRFNVADIAGMEIVDATFSTRSGMQADRTMTVKLTRAGTDFDRETTNWNNRPSRSGELASVLYDSNSGRKNFVPSGDNLVNYINEHTLTGKQEVAFGLEYKDGDGGDLNWIGGKGDGAWGPVLELKLRTPLEGDTIYVVSDAYVKEAEPGDNFGAAADMGIRRADDGTGKETFIKFDISRSADAVAGAVRLTAYIGQHDSGTERDNFYVNVYAVEDTTWKEMEISWDSRPESGARLIEENVAWFGGGQAVEWSSDELTHYINAAIREGRQYVSFVLKGKDNTPGDRLWMAGREWRPMATSLIFDYTVPPPAQEMPVVADSYVSQAEGEQDTNFGDQADQHLINDDENEASKWIYFKYDLSDAYGESVSASLNVYGSIHNEATGLEEFHYEVFAVANTTWQEDEITWTNKPAAGNQALLTGTLYPGGRWFTLTSAAFTAYVNSAIKEGRDYITLVAKGTNPTPGKRAWLSGKEWRASYITLNYEPEAALPVFSPAAGDYIRSVLVSISTPTAGASIYYTTDGSDPDDTDGTLFEPGTGIELTDTTTIRAVAYAPDLKPSGIVAATYNVTPVGLPKFSPTPDVQYQKSVTVTISAEPEGSIIRYSDDGGEPATIYEEPLVITGPTLIRAQAYNEDFTFSTRITEAYYDVVETEPAPGVGPAGVGFADLSRDNQPELSLWLRAHDIVDADDGARVNIWSDQSGNSNDAHNDESSVGSNVPNTGESWKAAPSFVANGLNNWPAVHFGSLIGEDGDSRMLVVDDADNLDGGAGISIFMVAKRNQMYGDFAALFQKRDIRNQPAQSGYVLEMDGGANPNKMQFVLARDIFLKSQDEFNDEDYYIINVGLNSKHRLATFITNGELKSSALYSRPVQNVHAPVIIGGFQPVDIAEIVMFNSDMNSAQTVLVHNYLAAKYGLGLAGGRKYNSSEFIHDIIGIGREQDISGDGSEMHTYSSGGALLLSANAFDADGDYVIAGHNGGELSDDNDAKAWTRVWHVETSGNGGNVTMGFDFGAPGIVSEPSADYKLWHKADLDDESWTDLEKTADTDGEILNFMVEDIQNGFYAIGIESPDFTVDVRNPLKREDSFRVYPNPASDKITVEFENERTGNVMISIIDVNGRRVVYESVSKHSVNLKHEIDLSSLAPGFYFIEVRDDRQRLMERVFIK